MFKKVGTDIFTISHRDYLVTVDYFSQFIEVDYLPTSDTETIVHKLKSHFARHGIPETLISDNGPQFTSGHFKQFTKEWKIGHTTSSPGNSKANGAAEAAVKIVKNMMKKSLRAKEDMYLGLLNIRNTPQEGLTTSPVQRLMGRRTLTLIPTCESLLKPQDYSVNKERQLMEDKKSAVAERYQKRKTLRPLEVGETVRMQPIDNKTQLWKEATVDRKLKSRTYEIVTGDGRKYKRNRQYLRPARPRSNSINEGKHDTRQDESRHWQASQPMQTEKDNTTNRENGSETATETTPSTQCEGLTPSTETKYRTRSGREVTTPRRLNL